MKKSILVTLILAIAMLSFNQTSLLAQGKSDKELVVAGNNLFAIDLYKELSRQDGNLFFSPISMSIALAITYAGANTNTEAQMAEVLHFSINQSKLHPAFSDILKSLNVGTKRSGYRLITANRLWGQYGYEFLDNFINITDEYYEGGFKKVDFTIDREITRKKINQWVEEKTEEKIKNLIGEGVLHPLTRLVITNAIYFKGMWMSQFDESKTEDRSFNLLDGEIVKVPMMTQTDDFNYFETDNLKILEILYAGGEVSMVVLLPKKKDGLKALERSIDAKNVRMWLAGLKKRETLVFMPKFKMDSSFFLKDTLSSMGMTDAFSPEIADFSGIAEGRDLFISNVIHKAFVDVNEEGTKAAAATGIVMDTTSIEEPIKKIAYFNADHPFVFIIRDRRTKSILFLGRVTDPRQ